MIMVPLEQRVATVTYFHVSSQFLSSSVIRLPTVALSYLILLSY